MARATFPILLLAAGCGYSGGDTARFELDGAAERRQPRRLLGIVRVAGRAPGHQSPLRAVGDAVQLDAIADPKAVDWPYKPELNRAIHVDLRYLAWVMDAVDGADQLLVEMGLRPSLP